MIDLKPGQTYSFKVSLPALVAPGETGHLIAIEVYLGNNSSPYSLQIDPRWRSEVLEQKKARALEELNDFSQAVRAHIEAMK